MHIYLTVINHLSKQNKSNKKKEKKTPTRSFVIIIIIGGEVGLFLIFYHNAFDQF